MKINLPFYWRVTDQTSKASPVPEWLPFEWDWNSNIGLLQQKKPESLLNNLKTVYQLNSNIGYLRKDNILAESYGVDWYRFLEKFIQAPNQKILEIGCGGCVILEKMKKAGHSVTGIDPSPFAKEAGDALGIGVVQEFFPSPRLTEKFDFIFHMDVLEHVSDPVAFLKSHHAQLKPGAKVSVSVPDCTECFAFGDLSMIIHQHLNYFTTKSLKRTMEAAGFVDVKIESAGYGGSLYGLGTFPCEAHASSSETNPNELKEFLGRAERNVSKFIKLNERLFQEGVGSVGIYCPLRFLPYFENWDQRVELRFLDDTPIWHHKKFDGVPIEIENFADLGSNPVEHVLLMSLTFEKPITAKLSELSGLRVTTLREILEGA